MTQVQLFQMYTRTEGLLRYFLNEIVAEAQHLQNDTDDTKVRDGVHRNMGIVWMDI